VLISNIEKMILNVADGKVFKKDLLYPELSYKMLVFCLKSIIRWDMAIWKSIIKKLLQHY